MWTFTTEPPDLTAPTVTDVYPVDLATDVPVGTVVTATFDEALDPATVTTLTFTLTPSGGSAEPATVTWDPGTLTAQDERTDTFTVVSAEWRSALRSGRGLRDDSRSR